MQLGRQSDKGGASKPVEKQRAMAIRTVCLVILFVAYGCVHGIVEVTPPSFTPGLSLNLDVKCTIGSLAYAIKDIYVVQLEKVENNNQAALATMTKDSAPVNFDHTNRTQVTGQLTTGHFADAFLQLSISHPEASDAGKYRCSVSIIDKSNVIKTIDFDAQVDADVLDNVTSMVLKKVQHELENIVKENKRLETQLSLQQADIAALKNLTRTCCQRTKDHQVQNTPVANITTYVAALQAQQQTAGQCCQATADLQNLTKNLMADTAELAKDLKTLSADQQVLNQTTKTDMATLNTIVAQAASDLMTLKSDTMTDRIHINMAIGYGQRNDEKITNLTNQLQMKEDQAPHIAFHAKLPPQPSNVATFNDSMFITSQLTNVEFSDIKLNEGQGLRSNGTFIAPVAGTYAFFVNFPIKDKNHRNYEIMLTKNEGNVPGDMLGMIESGTLNGQQPSNPVSIMRVERLQAGDRVHVTLKEVPAIGGQQTAEASVYSSYFAGYLLHP